ncbi:MAG: phosphopyruvate hydratase, partial [Candidatus Diapherotrites archaeon]
LPTPQMVVIEGGAHGEESTDFQEFMIAPVGAKSFSDALRFGAEVYQTLKKILLERKLNANVGFEGAFTPKLNSNSAAVELIVGAIEEAGYSPGKDIAIALDPAASEFFKDGKYELASEEKSLSPEEMVDYLMQWIESYPIVSIEDGLSEDDWDAWVLLNKKAGRRVQIVGDDLIVTNTQLIQRAIDMGAINAALIKPNQIGTVSETINAINLAKKNELQTIVSHRGGDTEDTFISDLVVGMGCGQSKFGATSRGERTAKYNQLLRIEERLGKNAVYNGKII